MVSLLLELGEAYQTQSQVTARAAVPACCSIAHALLMLFYGPSLFVACHWIAQILVVKVELLFGGKLHLLAFVHFRHVRLVFS